MDVGIEVNKILGEAERRLSELTAEALRQKDYAAVQWLSLITQRVAASKIDMDRKTALSVGGDLTNASSDTATAPESNHGSGEKLFIAKPTDSSAGSKMFPQFYGDGDQLVKIGYSKSERRTYEHRSPRDVLDRLTELLIKIGDRGQQFTTEHILSRFQQQTPVVPSYQIYLCLAFLVRQGLVRRRGRSDYSTENEAGDFSAAVKAAWDKLSPR
jgi:hypothetical protein